MKKYILNSIRRNRNIKTNYLEMVDGRLSIAPDAMGQRLIETSKDLMKKAKTNKLTARIKIW